MSVRTFKLSLEKADAAFAAFNWTEALAHYDIAIANYGPDVDSYEFWQAQHQRLWCVLKLQGKSKALESQCLTLIGAPPFVVPGQSLSPANAPQATAEQLRQLQRLRDLCNMVLTQPTKEAKSNKSSASSHTQHQPKTESPNEFDKYVNAAEQASANCDWDSARIQFEKALACSTNASDYAKWKASYGLANCLIRQRIDDKTLEKECRKLLNATPFSMAEEPGSTTITPEQHLEYRWAKAMLCVAVARQGKISDAAALFEDNYETLTNSYDPDTVFGKNLYVQYSWLLPIPKRLLARPTVSEVPDIPAELRIPLPNVRSRNMHERTALALKDQANELIEQATHIVLISVFPNFFYQEPDVATRFRMDDSLDKSYLNPSARDRLQLAETKFMQAIEICRTSSDDQDLKLQLHKSLYDVQCQLNRTQEAKAVATTFLNEIIPGFIRQEQERLRVQNALDNAFDLAIQFSDEVNSIVPTDSDASQAYSRSAAFAKNPAAFPSANQLFQQTEKQFKYILANVAALDQSHEIQAYIQYARFCESANDYVKAEATYDHILSTLDRQPSLINIITQDSLIRVVEDLVRVLLNQNNYKKAETVLRNAISKHSTNSDSHQRIQLCSSLAHCFAAQQKYADAEHILLEALRELEAQALPSPFRLRMIYVDLSRLLRALPSRKADAERYEKKAAQLASK